MAGGGRAVGTGGATTDAGRACGTMGGAGAVAEEVGGSTARAAVLTRACIVVGWRYSVGILEGMLTLRQGGCAAVVLLAWGMVCRCCE